LQDYRREHGRYRRSTQHQRLLIRQQVRGDRCSEAYGEQ